MSYFVWCTIIDCILWIENFAYFHKTMKKIWIGKTWIVYIFIEWISRKIFQFCRAVTSCRKMSKSGVSLQLLKEILALHDITLKKAYWTTKWVRQALRVGYFQSTFCDMTFLLVKIYNRCVLQEIISQDVFFSHLFKGHLISV